MLSAADRDFFALVSEATFTNPFGDQRAGVDRRISRAPRGASREDIVERLLHAVQERLRGLGAVDVRRYTGDDRALLEQAVLFDVFHRYAGAFDAHIQKQLDAGARPLRVPFGREALAAIAAYGLGADDARHYFALFYQLRRAFYFIDQTLPGACPSMQRLRERLWTNVFTHDVGLYARVLWRRMEDFSTFLLGETGAGKGTAAAAIGHSGWIPYDEKSETFAASFVQSFLAINLAQFPEALIESELFGHKKGAFTGAVDGHQGVLARCSPYGAIFLDEIGEISVPVQTKLLRVLQERTFSPVGGHETARFAGRVIAATNRPLDDLRANGRLRDDFYYRLCSDVIEVPSLAARLREDPAELDALLALILRRILGRDAGDADVRALHARAREVIDRDLGPAYPWPGNVRELEQCVRRVVLTRAYPGDRLLRGKTGDRDMRLLEAAGEETAKGLLTRYCAALYAVHGSYEEVARRTGLDRRTVKAYVAPE
jgi:DNA-binding NtrC family response regulator